jgi:hypothetical protein
MGLYNCGMLWRAMIVGCLLLGWSGWSCAAEPVVLDVRTEPTGGVRATAIIFFPAPVSVIQAILTDYTHWPELFEVQMRVVDVTIQNGVATTDLRIEHALMPGERRLVTESRMLPNGELVADLKGGDFKRYHRRWKLTSVDDGAQTRADFELACRCCDAARSGIAFSNPQGKGARGDAARIAAGAISETLAY